jgi:hypothetical protein
VLVAVAVLVVAPAVGFGAVYGVMSSQPAAQPPVTPTPGSPLREPAERLLWRSAFVQRDDTTVTLITGIDGCRRIVGPRAEVIEEDHAQVVISVSGRVVPADDCAQHESTVPVTLSLPSPLDGRELADATGSTWPLARVYFEQHLPVLESMWSRPVLGSWPLDDNSWYQSHNGPSGNSLIMQASSGGGMRGWDSVETVPLGPHHGTIVELADWVVWWEAGDAVYTLRITPAEGSEMSLDEFKEELARLTWD